MRHFIAKAATGLTFIAQTLVTEQEVLIPKVAADDSSLRIILQIVFGAISLVAVIFMVMTGLKMVLSQGDPQGIAKARQSIIFASLGLIIAVTAEIIVTFVVKSI